GRDRNHAPVERPRKPLAEGTRTRGRPSDVELSRRAESLEPRQPRRGSPMEAGHSQGHPAVPPETRDGPHDASRTTGEVAMIRSAPALRSPHVINIEDLRRQARRRLPRVVFNYVDGGADDEITLRENCRVFQDVTFRPRQAVDVSS